MNKPEIQNSIEYKEVLAGQEKEKLWAEAFWSEYKPDYNFEHFFKNLESKFFVSDKENGSEKDKQKFDEIHSLIKGHGYKLNISFLETLSSDQKRYISQLFLDECLYFLDSKYKMGKSLLLWACFLWLDESPYSIDNLFYKIAQNFDGFNLKYFRQACATVNMTNENNLYNVIKYYNFIKKIDDDIKSTEIQSALNLWKDFSLWVFHHSNTYILDWYEEKYWWYDLNSKWEKFDLSSEWWIEMYDENDMQVPYARALDRNDASVFKDASWIRYEVSLDSPTWIALFYHNKPIACISFYIKNWNEIFINQIQKIAYYEYDRYWRCTWKHNSNILDKIDWQDKLYDIVIKLAKKYTISRITIQWWKNNIWTKINYKDPGTSYFRFKNCSSICFGDCDEIMEDKWIRYERKIHLSPEIAHKIYDVFAEEHWFKEGQDWNREKEI